MVLYPFDKPVSIRGGVLFLLMKLQGALMNYSTPFPSEEISQMILNTTISLYETKTKLSSKEFARL